MIKKIVIGVILIAIIAVALFKNNRSMKEYYDGPEALQWLKNNKNPYALASNHFKSTQEAISFVERLYSEGAEFVKISQKCIKDDSQTVKEEGGAYADGIVVKLSSNKTKRRHLIDICNNELDPEYKGNLERDIQSDMIFLWWD